MEEGQSARLAVHSTHEEKEKLLLLRNDFLRKMAEKERELNVHAYKPPHLEEIKPQTQQIQESFKNMIRNEMEEIHSKKEKK